MAPRGRVGTGLTALCIAVAISGCGEEDGGTDPRDLATLLDHVPSGAHELRFADLTAMKEQLGLSENADAADLPIGEYPRIGKQRLATTAAQLLPYLQFGHGTDLHEAIDHRAIEAAASNGATSAIGVSVIRTGQPFDEIAATLEDEGYIRDGNVVRDKGRGAPTSSRGSIEVIGPGERIKPDPLKAEFVRQFSYPIVADARDGSVVLGFERRTVENAIRGSTESDDPVRALIEEVEGVALSATAVGDHCVQALAVGESFDPDTAEVRIEIEDEASADRFRLPELEYNPRLEYGEPEAEGGTLTVEITGGRDPDVPGVQLAQDLAVSALDPDRIYAC